MLNEVEFNDRKSDMTSISEALGMLEANKITEEEYFNLEETTCPSCGSCDFLGTANTIGSLSEAIVLTLPGGALIPATHPDRFRLAQESGEDICKLVKNNITVREVINKESLEDTIKVCMTISGSTNAVLHLIAIAYEAQADIVVLDSFEKHNESTPRIAKVNPAAK